MERGSSGIFKFALGADVLCVTKIVQDLLIPDDTRVPASVVGSS
jgi:hypothetical protein